MADVHAVHDAGGQLIVSPNCNVEVVRAAVGLGMVCLPGACLLIHVDGITPSNMPAYPQAGASGFGMGSNLYTAGKTLDAVRQSAIELIAV